jgi:hypothetical protein
MRSFVFSDTKPLESVEIVVKNERTGESRVMNTLGGSGAYKNFPINMNMVFTFEKRITKQPYPHDTQQFIEYPTIVFINVDYEPIATWYYPHTEEGKVQRDYEFSRLQNKVSLT